MSSDYVEEIHIRLREELELQGLSLADASRAIGDATSQGLRDVCSGRKRATAELIGRLSVTGIDVRYVLTGERASSNRASTHDLPADEQLLLDGYRALSAAKKKQLLASLLTGDVAKKPAKSGGGVVVSGSGNRTAGRDYHE